MILGGLRAARPIHSGNFTKEKVLLFLGQGEKNSLQPESSARRISIWPEKGWEDWIWCFLARNSFYNEAFKKAVGKAVAFQKQREGSRKKPMAIKFPPGRENILPRGKRGKGCVGKWKGPGFPPEGGCRFRTEDGISGLLGGAGIEFPRREVCILSRMP